MLGYFHWRAIFVIRTLPGVLLTPHIGSNPREANERMAGAALANAAHFLAGRLGELTRVGQPYV